VDGDGGDLVPFLEILVEFEDHVGPGCAFGETVEFI